MNTRKQRIQARFIKRFGVIGSANVLHMTGKQAKAYGKSIGRENKSVYGEAFQPYESTDWFSVCTGTGTGTGSEQV